MADPVLVAGATGQLGSAIVRKLVASGVPVRALARNRQKLDALERPGVETVSVNMLNLAALTDACRGVGQVISTANNFLGKGPNSPMRVDLTAHQNLCAAARNTGVRRVVYVSFRGVDQDAPVDFFRIKWYIEDAIRRSGVPYVLLRPTAFMDTWVALMADSIRRRKSMTIFGDGTGTANYIAVDDVAEFAVRILADETIVNEAIEVGGPSTVSLNDLATLVEKKMNAPAKRRHMPVVAMKLLPPVFRLFNETVARLMTLGYYATLRKPFPTWQAAADRFGVAPRTIEQFVQQSSL